MPSSRRTPARGPNGGPKGGSSPVGPRSPAARPRRPAASGATVLAADPPRQTRVTGRAAVLVLVLLVLVISYASSLRAWLQQRSEISATRVEIARTSAEVTALEQERLRWEDPAYIAQQARERFGWVLPGEVGYRVIGVDGATLGAPRPPDPLPDASNASQAWYDDVWGSISAAGETPETAAEPPPAHESGVIAPPSGRGARHR